MIRKAYFREGSTLRDFFDAFDERTEILSSNFRIPHQLDKVFSDDNCAPLHFHASIIKCAHEKRYQNCQSGGSHFCNKGCGRKRLNASGNRVWVSHAFHEHWNVRSKIGVRKSGAQSGGAFYCSRRNLSSVEVNSVVKVKDTIVSAPPILYHASRAPP